MDLTPAQQACSGSCYFVFIPLKLLSLRISATYLVVVTLSLSHLNYVLVPVIGRIQNRKRAAMWLTWSNFVILKDISKVCNCAGFNTAPVIYSIGQSLTSASSGSSRSDFAGAAFALVSNRYCDWSSGF